jgi:hypothetical protein
MTTKAIGHGWLTALLLGCLLLAQGCASLDGREATSGATSGSGRRSPSSGSGSGPVSGAGGLPGGLGDPVQARNGVIAIAISSQTFPRDGRITAVITNGLDRTVYTEDSKSDCSILLLQRLEGGSWIDVPACAERRPPLVVAVGASHARTISINPRSVNFAAVSGSSEPALEPGIYRLKLSYSFTRQEGEEQMAVYSQRFRVSP